MHIKFQESDVFIFYLIPQGIGYSIVILILNFNLLILSTQFPGLPVEDVNLEFLKHQRRKKSVLG